ncbi:MAG: DNA polymerase III subunit beta [Flavobacteriales bacterium]|nr:DNA polymerase III subunit beta [Flavobacteriales bacterium]
MEFTVSSSALLRSVNTLSGIISSNSTLPILDNFLFEQKNGRLTILASDLETTMISSLDVDGSGEGKIAVPAKMLAEILKTFPEQPITFFADADEHLLKMSYGSADNEGKCDIPYEEADEYPQQPAMENVTQTVVTSEILASAIQKTLFATGNDDMRPVMSGVLFKFTPEGLIFVATDAHKLVKYIREDITSPVPVEFIMPKKPLNIMKTMMAGMACDVTITFNQTNARFETEDIVIICRLIDGKYPNYEAVIPKENPNQLLIDRISFQNSLRRIALFSNKTTHQTRLSLSPAEVIISAEDNEQGKRANEKAPCEYRGDKMDIGFNSRFLLEMLGNLESKDVTIDMSQPNRAGILRPVDSPEGESTTMLVMPVILSN